MRVFAYYDLSVSCDIDHYTLDKRGGRGRCGCGHGQGGCRIARRGQGGGLAYIEAWEVSRLDAVQEALDTWFWV